MEPAAQKLPLTSFFPSPSLSDSPRVLGILSPERHSKSLQLPSTTTRAKLRWLLPHDRRWARPLALGPGTLPAVLAPHTCPLLESGYRKHSCVHVVHECSAYGMRLGAGTRLRKLRSQHCRGTLAATENCPPPGGHTPSIAELYHADTWHTLFPIWLLCSTQCPHTHIFLKPSNSFRCSERDSRPSVASGPLRPARPRLLPCLQPPPLPMSQSVLGQAESCSLVTSSVTLSLAPHESHLYRLLLDKRLARTTCHPLLYVFYTC